MKDTHFGWAVFILTVGLTAVLLMSSCVSQAEFHPPCPVCDESYASEEHLNSHCATNFEGVETQTGAHDFFLEGEDKITSSKLATKCQACGIYFTYPDYEEHIKTCYP